MHFPFFFSPDPSSSHSSLLRFCRESLSPTDAPPEPASPLIPISNPLRPFSFPSHGGLKVFFPGLVANVAGAGEKLHERHVKKDLEIESHDGVLQVRKGEMLFGYQPCATAGQFVPDRFVSDEGSKLLQYVYWSNGRETESPSVGNKQCPGKNLVVLVGRLLVVELFLRYDTFTATVDMELLGTSVFFTGVTKATSGPGASSSE